MSFFGIGLSTLLAICCAIHVILSGQNRYWLFALFLFPYLGSVAYMIAVLLPILQGSRSAYLIESQLRSALNPKKELREAKMAMEITPTVDAKTRLAKALVDNGRVKEALPYYQQALSNIPTTAPDILLEYAHALYQDQQFEQALEHIEQLRNINANYNLAERQLLYANILVALERKEQAQLEFNELLGDTPTFEALSCYLKALIHWGDNEEAKKQLQEYRVRLKQMPTHAKRLNARWIKEIKQSEVLLK